VTFGKTTPVLRILDEAKAKEFYVNFLGFKVNWEHRFEPGFPIYMEVSKDGCVLHLTEHRGDCNPGAAVRIETNDVDGYHAELAMKGSAYGLPGVENKPWGTREMTVTDPFDNKLSFTNAIST
jgi:uncharacterized glyoxalase superfamily protein PhnB